MGELLSKLYLELAHAVPKETKSFREIKLEHHRDKYGVALMMIAQGCDDPEGVGTYILNIAELGMEKVNGQARADDDIEITPEMIEAGRIELLRYDPRLESVEDAVHNIFAAMLEASFSRRLGVRFQP